MKIVGSCPLYERHTRKNYIIPIAIYLFRMVLLLGKVKYVFDKKFPFGNFLTQLNIFNSILNEIIFMAILLATVTKISSWNVLFEVTGFCVNDKKISFQKMMVIILNISYILSILIEAIEKDFTSIGYICSWLDKHISEYLMEIMTYFIIEFLAIVYMFYNHIDKILTDILKKKLDGEMENLATIHVNGHLILEIRTKYLYYYNLQLHCNNIFGWPICFIIIQYIITMLINIGYIVFDHAKLNVHLKIITLTNTLIFTVSIFSNIYYNRYVKL